MDTNITILLKDGWHTILASELSMCSKSSFCLCDTGNGNVHRYLTKDELLQILACLNGKLSIVLMNENQLNFITANRLIPGCIIHHELKAREAAAQLILDSIVFRDRHIALLAGTLKVVLDHNAGVDTRNMYSDNEHIVPVQVSYTRGLITMISICEGVPIYTPEHGTIPIVSDNLYETRTNGTTGFCIAPSSSGRCIADGDCTIHSVQDKLESPNVSVMSQTEPRSEYSCCCGAHRPQVHSTNRCIYSNTPYRYAHSPTHLPYFKHTATQDKADSVMRVLRLQCEPVRDEDHYILSGYVNIR